MARESFKQGSRVPNIFSGTVTEAGKAHCNFQNNETHKPFILLPLQRHEETRHDE